MITIITGKRRSGKSQLVKKIVGNKKACCKTYFKGCSKPVRKAFEVQ